MKQLSSSRATTIIALAVSVAIALALRVLPAYDVVFTRGIVNFQEPDAWFHVRTVHNLLAHFPHRSGFDPYVLFPGGQNVPTGPVWDYMLATPAWILGWGSPSAALIDRVAAWMPAILGAIFPIPAFFLMRRLYGAAAGTFAALWMATGYGVFMWLTHLGLTDHHAAEGLFAFLTMASMCAAVDGAGTRFAWLSGISLGLYMGIRPAGIFVPATLACMVVLEPAASALVLRAVVVAGFLFFPASGTVWSEYSWLSLAATGALAAIVLALDTLARRRRWPTLTRRSAPFAVMALGFAAVLLAMPHLLGSLWFEIRRLLGREASSRMVAIVQELQPIYRAGSQPGWRSIFQALGVAWIPAFPVVLWRPARPAARLLALWTMVMGIATIVQVRMAVYFLPMSAVLAGVACAWLMHRARPSRRLAIAGALAVIIVAVNLPWAIVEMHRNGGVTGGRQAAYAWLRENSPEPLRDAGSWWQYFARARPGSPGVTGAWGVAIWWDFGYELEQLAHRIPMSNGTQAGADEMARFYTETIPEAAVGWLRRSGARYVVLDPQGPMFAGEYASHFPVQIRMLGRNLDTYLQILYQRDSEGNMRSLPVYLPTYYQTMVSRLFQADGEAVAGTGPWVFETEPTKGPRGKNVELIVSSRHFASQAEAAVYLDQRRFARLTVGCLSPAESCFALPAVEGLKRVFSSDLLPVSPDRAVRAVKIFQVTAPD